MSGPTRTSRLADGQRPHLFQLEALSEAEQRASSNLNRRILWMHSEPREASGRKWPTKVPELYSHCPNNRSISRRPFRRPKWCYSFGRSSLRGVARIERDFNFFNLNLFRFRRLRNAIKWIFVKVLSSGLAVRNCKVSFWSVSLNRWVHSVSEWPFSLFRQKVLCESFLTEKNMFKRNCEKVGHFSPTMPSPELCFEHVA